MKNLLTSLPGFLPLQAYKADLDQLGNTLIKVHPNALKFISREAFLENY
ncbi:MAG: hypothetical protein V9F82_07515 [Dermatophilaceae bacterium]